MMYRYRIPRNGVEMNRHVLQYHTYIKKRTDFWWWVILFAILISPTALLVLMTAIKMR